MLNAIGALHVVAIVLLINVNATRGVSSSSFINATITNFTTTEGSDGGNNLTPVATKDHVTISSLPPPGPECEIGRSCDPSMYENGCDTSKRKFIIFGNDGSGIGNQLVFFPSVYVLAIAQGRQILLEDGTVISKLCNLIDSCNFRTVHNASIEFPELKSSLRNVRTVKLHEFIEWSKNPAVVWNDVIVRASGYKEDLSWWSHSSSLSACVSRRHYSRIAASCCYRCVSCASAQSLISLFPGNHNLFDFLVASPVHALSFLIFFHKLLKAGHRRRYLKDTTEPPYYQHNFYLMLVYIFEISLVILSQIWSEKIRLLPCPQLIIT